MKMCRLTVSAPEGVWQGEVGSWTGWRVLASLSAEPESLAELAEAVRRYEPEHRVFDRPGESAGGDEDEAAGPWCLVDLAGRTVVAGGGFDLPDPRGAYEADAEDDARGFPIVWLDTPADWRFLQAGDDWRAVVAARAASRAAAPRVDARAVLFGPPLLEHLADGVLAAAAAGDVDEQREQEQTRALHARWLLTARADLGGRAPREALLADRHRIAWDMEHRSEQWSLQRHAAPPLPPDSSAYRLGGFGTVEVVLYFDLVRALLAQAWELARREPRPARPSLVRLLAEFRDRWLHEPSEATDFFLPPAELIESERRRMPVTSGGSHLHADCPICQAEAEGDFGPAFLCFDGHHLELEDEFAFSLCETREEWEREQERDRKFMEEMDRKDRERAAGGPDAADPLLGSVWKSSFVDWDAVAGDASPVDGLLALGFPLAELTCHLRDGPGGVELLRALNGAYADLRASQDAAAKGSAAGAFRELLEVVARTFPDLTPRCADLQSRLDEVLRRLS
jgi:hypothetical protein